MVDINLIGDDQAQQEGEENEKDFRDTYESDIDEPTPSHYMGSGHIDDSDYTKVISRGGSKKLVYILAACSIILLAVVAYFMFQPGKSKKPVFEPTTTVPEPKIVEDTTQAFSFEPTSDMVSTQPILPALRDKIVKSHKGINTVRDILNTIPSNINFTMITYSDGKFLFEFLAASDADIENVNNQLKQNLYSANINLVSKDNRNIQRRQLRQALVNGDVDLNQITSGLTSPQEPAYLSSSELQNQLSNICRQSGLTIKQFDAGLEKSDGDFMDLPIKFKAVGSKDNILAFLQQLLSQNINISFSKISLIANDVGMTDSNITLLLNMELYRLI